MNAGMRASIAAVCASVALSAPAAASAKVVTWGGAVAPEGTIALDAKVNKFGFAKTIIGLRGKGIPTQCPSGPSKISVNLNRENTTDPDGSKFGIKVKRNGKFSFSYTDPTYNLTRSIKGKFAGPKDKRVGGEFQYGAHYPADAYLPEENCDTGTLDYSATKNGTDVVLPRGIQR